MYDLVTATILRFESNKFAWLKMIIIISCLPKGLKFISRELKDPIRDEWWEPLWQPCWCPLPKLSEVIKPRRWEADPHNEARLRYVRGDLLCGVTDHGLKTRTSHSWHPHSSVQLDAHLDGSTTHGCNIFINDWFIILFQMCIMDANQIKHVWQLSAKSVIKLQYDYHEYGRSGLKV